MQTAAARSFRRTAAARASSLEAAAAASAAARSLWTSAPARASPEAATSAAEAAAADAAWARAMAQGKIKEVMSSVINGAGREGLPGSPYTPATTYSSAYATEVANPALQDFSHVGKYYTLAASEEELAGLFPGGLPKDLTHEFELTGTNALLVRPTSVALTRHLEHWRHAHGRKVAAAGAPVKDIESGSEYAAPDLALPEAPAGSVAKGVPNTAGPQPGPAPGAETDLSFADPTKIDFRSFRLLTGPSGIGKSAVLAHLVAYARRNRWVSVYVPDSLHLLQDSKVIVPSRRNPGMVDQHDLAVELIRATLKGQEELLGSIPQRRRYPSFKYLPPALDKKVSAEREKARAAEEEEKGRLKAQAEAAGQNWDPASYVSKVDDESDVSRDRSSFTLGDMLTWALAHPDDATDAVSDLLAELRLTTEFPVLIAVDGMNLLYEPTNYPERGSGELLPASRLSLMAAFHALGPEGFKPSFNMKRGVFIGAVTLKHGAGTQAMFKGANVRPRFRVRVPELTRPELHSQLLHYHHTGQFFMVSDRQSVDGFAVEYYRVLTGGRPREVCNAAMFQPQ